MTQKFKIIHGFQENLSGSVCRGCFSKQISTVENSSFPSAIYLMIVRLDNSGNETKVVDSYCSKCAIEFYNRKADELAGQQKVQEMRKDKFSK